MAFDFSDVTTRPVAPSLDTARERAGAVAPETMTTLPITDSGRAVLVGASALGGCAVFGRDGVQVGVVTEVIVDVMAAAGNIAYLLIAPSHPAPGSSELQALPWSVATFDPTRHRFTLHVTAQRFIDAPLTLGRGWPVKPGDTWKTEVHRYYHAQTPEPVAQAAADPMAMGSPFWNLQDNAAQPDAPAATATAVAAPDASHDFLPELGLRLPFTRRTIPGEPK